MGERRRFPLYAKNSAKLFYFSLAKEKAAGYTYFILTR